MLAGESPIGISRAEGEIAYRLLQSSDLNAIPVVFRNDGALLALSSENAARIFSTKAIELDPSPHCTTSLEELAPSPAIPPIATGLRQRITAGLRSATRTGISRLPASVREDVRIILIHARQIARTATYRNARSTITQLRVPESPIKVPDRTPSNISVLRDEILPTLRLVVYPRAGDVLWTAGLYSRFVPLRAIGEMRGHAGLLVVTTCYDLISATHPQFNPPSIEARGFEADAVALLDASDLVLAVSEWTRQELLTFAARSGRASPAVQVIKVGSNLTVREASRSETHPSLLERLTQRRFALAVGTVEPLKNYRLLLRLWERLVADPAFSLDLVIVGRAGLDAEESVAEIERSPLLGSRILWLKNVTDATLCRLYETCHVVLCPSYVDGWGLPITEALSFGRQVIASNRGAVPEVSCGAARLLDPEDEDAWGAALTEAAAAARLEVPPADEPSWDIVAALIKAHLLQFVAIEVAA